MKKIYLTILGIFLISLVIAVGVSIKDKDIEIDSRSKDALVTKGISSWDYKDTKIGDDYIERDLISPSDYNLPSQRFQTYWMECLEYKQQEDCVVEFNPETNTTNSCDTEECLDWKRNDYTEKEMDDFMDDWEKETMESIGNVIKDREERASQESKEEIKTGTTTPKIKELEK